MIYTGVNFGTALQKGYRQVWPNKPNWLLFLYVSLEKKFIAGPDQYEAGLGARTGWVSHLIL
jgi:hypothetical protein